MASKNKPPTFSREKVGGKLEKILFKIIEYGCYLALFSPLIVAKSYFFPYVVPKTIFFRIVVDVIFIAYVILAVSNPKYRPKITPLTIAIAAFVAILFLTAILGVNFERSFWSVFERMTGLLTFLYLFAFYIVLTSCFKEKKYWERIMLFSVCAALLISFYALTSDNPTNRAGGTLGNSSFFSSYLIFNIFFAGIMFIWQKGARRVFYVLALAFLTFLLFFNPSATTKGAISSFAVGVVLFGAGAMLFSGKKLLKLAAPVFLALMVLLGIFIVKNFHFKDRPFNLLDTPDRSRQIVWHMGFEAWQEKFWLGWGWENFNIPFAKYYDPELPFTGDAWYDRVHNVVLDTGVAAGIIGLLSYLSIFAAAIFGLGRWAIPGIAQARLESGAPLTGQAWKKETLVSLALITLLLVYFLQNLWVFDMISSYIMFFMTLAFIGFLIYPKAKEEQEMPKALSLPMISGVLLIVLAVFSLFYGNIQPARASKEIIKGLAFEIDRSLPAFQKAFTLSPITQFEGPERFSSRLNDLVFQQNINQGLLLAGFQLAEQELEKAILKNPKVVRLMMFLGKHYNAFYQITGSTEKLVQASEVLQKAIELSPGNQQLYWVQVQTKIYQGEFAQALSLAEKTVAMEPRLFNSHLVAIQVAQFSGDNELTQEKIKQALEINPAWEQGLTPHLSQ